MDKILIIEKYSNSMDSCVSLLSKNAYEIDCVHSDEGLQALTQHYHQLLITDLPMEDARGGEIFLRAKELHPPMDVILVTCDADIESAILAVKAGIWDYIPKPVDPKKMIHSVEQCFRQRKLKNENEELKKMLNLFQICQEVAASLDIGRVQQLLTDGLAGEYGVGRALGIFKVDGHLEPVIVKGFPQSFATAFKDAVLSHITRNVSTNCLMMSCKLDSSSSSLPDTREIDITEACLILVRIDGVLQGIIALFNDSGLPLPLISDKKRNVLFLLEQSARAYRNAETYSLAKNMLFIDDLSGLFNHRYLDGALDRELKRVERYNSRLAVLFLDLDSFKIINDTYGHLTGSRVLSEMGILLKQSVREVDIVIRYGGDEFTIILIETTPETAAIVAERIRKNIAMHNFLAEDELDIHVTCSIGIACCPEDTMSRIELLEMADKAMYTGKAGGRNSVNRFSLSPKEI